MGGWYRRLTVVTFRRFNSSFSRRSNSIISQPIVFQRNNSPFAFVDGAKRFMSMNVSEKGFGKGKLIDLLEPRYEPVPYTDKRQLVLLKSSVEKQLGDHLFETIIKAKYRGKILASSHPKSVRIQKIMLRLAKAGENEILSEKTKIGEEKGRETTQFKWEVVIVNDPSCVNAACLPGGKIVVFTGLLNHFGADADIATCIGHEVAHVVARHHADIMIKLLLNSILKSILNKFFKPDVVFKMTKLLVISERREYEADYIGMLLMASAGYDPRVAPRVFDKLGEIGEKIALKKKSSAAPDDLFSQMVDYVTAHPCGKKRAQQLSQPRVMEEALSIYRKVLAQCRF